MLPDTDDALPERHAGAEAFRKRRWVMLYVIYFVCVLPLFQPVSRCSPLPMHLKGGSRFDPHLSLPVVVFHLSRTIVSSNRFYSSLYFALDVE